MWQRLRADIAEEFASLDEPRRAERLEEWAAWKRDRARQQVKARKERERFLIKCIRQRTRPPSIQPLPRPPHLEAVAQKISKTIRLRRIAEWKSRLAKERR